jgi:hypothetical protein
MQKFKVGDRVIRVKNFDSSCKEREYVRSGSYR